MHTVPVMLLDNICFLCNALMQLASGFSLDFEFVILKRQILQLTTQKKSLIKLESADKFEPELINCALKNFSEKWTQFKLKLIKLKCILKSDRSKPINFSVAGSVQPSLVLWSDICLTPVNITKSRDHALKCQIPLTWPNKTRGSAAVTQA